MNFKSWRNIRGRQHKQVQNSSNRTQRQAIKALNVNQLHPPHSPLFFFPFHSADAGELEGPPPSPNLSNSPAQSSGTGRRGGGARRHRQRLKKQVPRPLCIRFMFKAPNPKTRTEESGMAARLMPTVRGRRALFEYVSAGVKPSVPEIGPALAHQRRQIILLHEFWIHVLQLS